MRVDIRRIIEGVGRLFRPHQEPATCKPGQPINRLTWTEPAPAPVSLERIIERSDALCVAIGLKSKSRASHEAYRLVTTLPDPTWAESAPGCTIYYGTEAEVAPRIEALRYSALTWLRALITPDTDWEPSAEWPQPDNLIAATRELAQYVPQNASSS